MITEIEEDQDLPEDYWSWTGEELVSLGYCLSFDMAEDRVNSLSIGKDSIWLFSRSCLKTLKKQIKEALK